jgi:hypothetical protein
MDMRFSVRFAAFVSTMAFTASAAAALPCETLANECFAYTGLTKNKCFYDVGTHASCADSPLGELLLERWSVSTPGAVTAVGDRLLTGSTIVDGACVEQFDSSLSSHLLQGEPSSQTLRSLKAALIRCANVIAPADLSRP